MATFMKASNNILYHVMYKTYMGYITTVHKETVAYEICFSVQW